MGRVGRGSTVAAIDAGKAALVTLLLALPLAGFRLEDAVGARGVQFRPLWVVVPVAVVFLGRLALELLGPRVPLPRWPSAAFSASSVTEQRRRVLFAVVLVAAVGLPWLPWTGRYSLDLATTFLLYVVLGWGLNIVVGLAGMLNLGYAAFYAAGAYTFGVLANQFGVGFWVALPVCALVAAALGALLALPVLRLKGDYLAIVTLGFGEIVRIVLINWTEVTGGPNGLYSIPRPHLFGWVFAAAAPEGQRTIAELTGIRFAPIQRIAWLYYVILALALATLALTARLRRLPIGRAWEALREDETAARAVGLNPTIIKLSAFALGATVAGLAGCFFAARQGFISPESFTFTESAAMLAIVVLGGRGSQVGVVLAAAVLVCLPELSRELAQFRMLTVGVMMILIMRWCPGGFMSTRAPSIRVDLLPTGAAPRVCR